MSMQNLIKQISMPPFTWGTITPDHRPGFLNNRYERVTLQISFKRSSACCGGISPADFADRFSFEEYALDLRMPFADLCLQPVDRRDHRFG